MILASALLPNSASDIGRVMIYNIYHAISKFEAMRILAKYSLQIPFLYSVCLQLTIIVTYAVHSLKIKAITYMRPRFQVSYKCGISKTGYTDHYIISKTFSCLDSFTHVFSP